MSKERLKSTEGKHLEQHPKLTEVQTDPAPPVTRALQGLLKDTDIDEQDYKAYLLKKYR